jgi:hypothetical protein
MAASLESLPAQAIPVKARSGRVEDILDLAESVSYVFCSCPCAEPDTAFFSVSFQKLGSSPDNINMVSKYFLLHDFAFLCLFSRYSLLFNLRYLVRFMSSGRCEDVVFKSRFGPFSLASQSICYGLYWFKKFSGFLIGLLLGFASAASTSSMHAAARRFFLGTHGPLLSFAAWTLVRAKVPIVRSANLVSNLGVE